MAKNSGAAAAEDKAVATTQVTAEAQEAAVTQEEMDKLKNELAEAQEALKKEKAQQNAPKVAAEAAEPEMVVVELFKDGDKYKDDVFVGVNDKRYQIQRGVPVKVPVFVKEVLDNSMKQDRQTAAKIGELTVKADVEELK